MGCSERVTKPRAAIRELAGARATGCQTILLTSTNIAALSQFDLNLCVVRCQTAAEEHLQRYCVSRLEGRNCRK